MRWRWQERQREWRLRWHRRQAYASCLRHRARLALYKRLRGRERIAIGLTEHMGDIVAAQPIARLVRERHPGAHIEWVVQSPFRELVAHDPALDGACAVSCFSAWMQLRGSGAFDRVYDLHVYPRRCQECEAPVYQGSGAAGVNTENYYDHGHLLAIACLNGGLPRLDAAPVLRISPGIARSVDALRLPERFVAVHGRSADAQRDWDDARWRELARYLAERSMTVVEVGTVPVLAGEHVRQLCGRLSLLQSAEVIRRARAFIGVDSGPAHLANAVGTFGVILLGPYQRFSRYLPFSGSYGDGSNAVLLRGATAVSDISPHDVLRALDSRLRSL